MYATTIQVCDIALKSFEFLLTLAAAAWAYRRFSREGVHAPRIEFALNLRDLGVQGEHRVVELAILASNKGNVEHRFTSIKLRVRGIGRGEELKRSVDHRLEFPQETLREVELVRQPPQEAGAPQEPEYFFVRPGVTQTFTFVTTIPRNVTYVLAHSAFRYQESADRHTTESAFKLDADAPAEFTATREASI